MHDLLYADIPNMSPQWDTSLCNGFALFFKFHCFSITFINIHEYANEIIFKNDHKMKGFANCITYDIKETCKSGGFMIVWGRNKLIMMGSFYDFPLTFKDFINIHEYAN